MHDDRPDVEFARSYFDKGLFFLNKVISIYV